VVRRRPSGVLQGAVMHRGQARLMQLPVPSSTKLARAGDTGSRHGREKVMPSIKLLQALKRESEMHNACFSFHVTPIPLLAHSSFTVLGNEV
jgi:hypothetical protein